MSITARNYAAQAAKDIRDFCAAQRKAKLTEEILVEVMRVEDIAGLIEEAIHFAAPDGGTIFNDNLKGLQKSEIHLPFPVMTVEYFMPSGGADLGENKMPVQKRLVLAVESNHYHPIENKHEPIDDCVMFFSLYKAFSKWLIMPVCLFVPKTDAIPDQSPYTGSTGLNCTPRVFLPIVYKEFYEQDPADRQLHGGAIEDVLGDVLAAFELLEALSCSNVRHEPIEAIDRRKNARRIRSGKLPIFETRILTIDSLKTNGHGIGYGGTHSSPRQHLRRGHIRRLPDKNVWVNSCVVGRAETGIIEKQYHVH